MSKSTKDKPYKGTKRDQYTIVLENLNSKIDLLVDGHSTLNQKFDKLDHRVEVLDRKFDVMDSNIYVLKNDVSVLKSDVADIKNTLRGHDGILENHEERITTLENNS